MRAAGQPDERQVFLGFDQVDIARIAENVVGWCLRVWIEMHGIEDLRIALSADIAQRAANVFEPFVTVLAAMAGHQDHAAIGIQERKARFNLTVERRVVIEPCYDLVQRVDHSVASYNYVRVGNVFF